MSYLGRQPEDHPAAASEKELVTSVYQPPWREHSSLDLVLDPLVIAEP